MPGLSIKAIREGNFTNWVSRAVLTMGSTPKGGDEITFFVDSIYDILYAMYNCGYPGWPFHVATYQLPSGTLIEDNIRVGGASFFERASVGHLQNIQYYDSVTCSANGNYVLISGATAQQFLVYRKGTLRATVATSFNMESMYISADAHYIIVGETASPYRIEVLEGV